MHPLDRLANVARPELVAKVVNMHTAKTQLSRLVEEAEAGEDVVLARAGKPVVRLVPVRPRTKRRLGQWRGKVSMSDDFDAPLSAEELAAWEGRGRS
jgi:prevent-host-death family protein